MKIPILYTTYNRIEYTKITLPALIERTPNGRIYVVDNGSTDGTQEYLKGLDLEYLTLNESNLGVTEVMNWFFDETKDSEWVAKVDNDTLMPFGWLEEMVGVASENEIDIVQACHYFVSFNHETWDDFEKCNEVISLDNGNLILHPYVGGSGIVIKREVIKDRIIPVELIWGWSFFQEERPEIKKAFYGGVWADLLDMKNHNSYSDTADFEYYVKTGRMRSDDGSEMKKLNLGSGYSKKKGYINVDFNPKTKPDVLFDIAENGLSFCDDDSVDEVVANDFLEHIPPTKTIFVIEEIYRVLKMGGKFEHLTPSTDGRGAFQDPTHLSFWNINSWYYFCPDFYEEMYGTRNGFYINARFRLVSLEDIKIDRDKTVIHTHGIMTKY